jgi:hypothetical protein
MARIDVAVQHAARVNVDERFEQPFGDVAGLTDGCARRMIVEDAAERLAVDELLRDVELLSVVAVSLKNEHVRMVEREHGLVRF